MEIQIMSSSGDKKSEQLGMNFGTASNRLRKNILFSLLVKLNENICFQCGKLIEDVTELSIEHKIPWLDNDPSLFWDLDNIAFSHLSCNCVAADRSHLAKNNYGKRIYPEGTKWCVGCKTLHDLNEFGKDNNRNSGYNPYCRKSRKNLPNR
jgi:hypothetical protein